MAGMREPLGQYSPVVGEIKMGPFISEVDGKTPLTGLALSQSDVRLSKNNGAFAQKNDTNSSTEDADGMYDITLNSNDLQSADNGHLIVAIHVPGALPLWRKFKVNASPPGP